MRHSKEKYMGFFYDAKNIYDRKILVVSVQTFSGVHKRRYPVILIYTRQIVGKKSRSMLL